MKNVCLVVCLAVLVLSSRLLGANDEHGTAAPQLYSTTALDYTWSSQRLPFAVWGIARADIDGDGSRELILLERHALRVGHIAGDRIEFSAYRSWSRRVDGIRLFAIDIDADGLDEIVVSATENGRPSSMAFEWVDGELNPLFEDVRWHLRVVTRTPDPASPRVLIGQRGSSSRFYAGKLYELSFDGGSLKRGKRVALPRWADIFRFAEMPKRPGGGERLVAIREYAPLEAFEKRGRFYRRYWASSARFGGSLNLVKAGQRTALGIVVSDEIGIGHEPLVDHEGDRVLVVAHRHDIPLRGAIGKRPAIRGGRIVGFVPDRALGLRKYFETVRFPGYIADYLLDNKGENGARSLILVLQRKPSLMSDERESIIVLLYLPKPKEIKKE